MNDRLEALRKRLRRPERKTINWQFWIGSPTAWLALVVSSATAFYTFFYYSDQLSLVMKPWLVLVSSTKLQIEGPQPLIFVNSGTRPIALLSVGIDVTLKQLGCYGHHIPLEFDEFVLKPFDTTVKVVSFKGKNVNGWYDLEARVGCDFRGDEIISLQFEIVSADSPVFLKHIEAPQIVGISQGNGYSDFGPANNLEKRVPQYLIKRNRFWTEVGAD